MLVRDLVLCLDKMEGKLVEKHELGSFGGLEIHKRNGVYIALNEKLQKYFNTSKKSLCAFAENKNLNELKETIYKKMENYLSDMILQAETQTMALKYTKENSLGKYYQALANKTEGGNK